MGPATLSPIITVGGGEPERALTPRIAALLLIARSASRLCG
jgi:hypothetical protein